MVIVAMADDDTIQVPNAFGVQRRNNYCLAGIESAKLCRAGIIEQGVLTGSYQYR